MSKNEEKDTRRFLDTWGKIIAGGLLIGIIASGITVGSIAGYIRSNGRFNNINLQTVKNDLNLVSIKDLDKKADKDKLEKKADRDELRDFRGQMENRFDRLEKAVDSFRNNVDQKFMMIISRIGGRHE